MPHLHDNREAAMDKAESHTGIRKASSAPIAVKITAQKPLRSVKLEGRQVSASPNESSTQPVKISSFESAGEGGTAKDPSSPHDSHPPKHIITPSPYVATRVLSPHSRQGPMISIHGNSRLFPSPIRVKKRSSNPADSDTEERNSPSPQMAQPSNLRYAESVNETPTRQEILRMMSTDSSLSQRGKRPASHILYEDSSIKKSKTANALGLTAPDSKSFEDERGRQSPGDSVSSEKKPVITPASSGEKGEEDNTSPVGSSGLNRYQGGKPYIHGYHHPSSYPYGAPPPYSGSYHQHRHMYSNVYHAPHHPHTTAAHHHHPYYPPHFGHPHHHGMCQYGAHGRYQLPGVQYIASTTKHMGTAPPPSRVVEEGSIDTSSNHAELFPAPSSSQGRKGQAINSVAGWQQAAISTGKYPSAGRCLPLKEPIPSRYWGEAEKTRDAVLPDFHCLINYPDYLAKPRNSSSDAGTPPAGKKNCVMCGKLRVCSSSSLVNRSKSKQHQQQPRVDTTSTFEQDDGFSHIIPRQNKGLCTACDVTVWVVVSNGMEIKWCKGCKNFRPWAAFGDKGSATKCVRCRDRQREKYAMQKDEIRLRRYKRGSSPTTSTTLSAEADKTTGYKKWEDSGEEDTHMAAVRGLRNLMKAATAT